MTYEEAQQAMLDGCWVRPTIGNLPIEHSMRNIGIIVAIEDMRDHPHDPHMCMAKTERVNGGFAWTTLNGLEVVPDDSCASLLE